MANNFALVAINLHYEISLLLKKLLTIVLKEDIKLYFF